MNNVQIKPGYRTDHSSVELELKLSDFKRGKGFWKMNNSLLKDKEYVTKVKQTIHTVVAIPIYDKNNLHNISPGDIQFILDDQPFFEQILLEIRGMTISYASHKNEVNKLKEKQLIPQIQLLEEITQNTCTNSILLEILEEHKNKLESLRKSKIDGMILRSKANWIENGEKPTKYFCSLEKRNFINKNIRKLDTNDGSTIVDQNLILNQVKIYYKNLYSSRDNTLNDCNLSHIIEKTTPTLTDQ